MPRQATLTTIALGIACGPILCCWIALASCCCPGRLRRRRHVESEDKRRFVARQAMAPQPLPVRRPERALTIRSHTKETDTEDEVKPKAPRGLVRDQSASRLMQLPLELRRMIYRAAIGDSTMHILLKPYTLGHRRCTAPRAADCQCGIDLFHGSDVWSRALAEPDEQPLVTDGGILPLLQTCRQVYSEAVSLLYTTNTFSFTDLDCLRYFSSTILPKRFSLVQRLSIDWTLSWPIYDPLAQNLLLSRPALYPPHDEATWESTWHIIAGMPNLKRLRVKLVYFHGFRDKECEERLLAPMRWVVGSTMESFEVYMGWAGEEVKDAPFRVVRPGMEDADDQ